MNKNLKSVVKSASVVAASVVGLAVAGPVASAQAWESVEEIDAANVVVSKEWRHLKGWESEKVPAYQCPTTHPYLIDQNFAPGGTTLIKGVEINQTANPWPIGVSVTVWTPEIDGDTGRVYSRGISSDALASSATNWDPLHTRAYQVKLHCTNDKAQAFSSHSAP